MTPRQPRGRAARLVLAGALVLAATACTRSERTIEIKPAFSTDTVIGTLDVRWAPTDRERPTGDSGAAERAVAFEVTATNLLADPVYLRLREPRLVGQGGELPAPDPGIACQLAPGIVSGLLRGRVWMPATQASGVHDFRVEVFAVPLSERGRAFYREFLLRQRPGDSAAIDTELAAYAAAPPCRADIEAPAPEQSPADQAGTS